MKRVCVAGAMLVAIAAGCGGDTGPRAASLEGSWQMRVTRAELTRNPAYAVYGAEANAKELARVDAGTYRLTLRRGRLEDVEHLGGGPCRDVGTYRTHGDRFTFHIASGCDAGETWVYRWSLYRGELSFRKDGRAPPNPTFAPWRRAGQPR